MPLNTSTPERLFLREQSHQLSLKHVPMGNQGINQKLIYESSARNMSWCEMTSASFGVSLTLQIKSGTRMETI